MEQKYLADGTITVVFGYSLARYIDVNSMPIQLDVAIYIIGELQKHNKIIFELHFMIDNISICIIKYKVSLASLKNLCRQSIYPLFISINSPFKI